MISVCMITYNHEAYIAEAIEGIVNQITDEPFELVIGEDCSTDKTREICEEYQNKYPKIIRLLPSDENLGVMVNLIRTYNACRGDHVAFCEGDDFWTLSSKIAKQSAFLKSSDKVVKAHAFNVEFYDQRSQLRKPFGEVLSQSLVLEDVLYTWPYHLSSLMVKVDSFTANELEFLKTVYSGDKFMNLILGSKGEIAYQGEVTSGVYRRHNEGLSASTDFMYKMNRDLTNFDAFKTLNPTIKSKIHRAMFFRYQSGLTDIFRTKQKISFREKWSILRGLFKHFTFADKKYFKGLIYYVWKTLIY